MYSLIGEVTSISTGCSRRTLVTPNIVDINVNVTNYINQIVRIPSSSILDKAFNFTSCDIVFTAIGQQLEIRSPSLSSQAGIRLINSSVHTCGDFLARGIVMTQTGDYVYPTNSTLEDMYAAIAIEPDLNNTTHSWGNFYLPMSGNTFKNNFIGLRINAPNATIVQHTTSSSINPVPIPIIDFFSHNTFTGSASIKPFNNASYPTNLISNLETGFNSSNWGSYAGFVGNNTSQFRFSDIPIVGATPSPNYFTNLVNGILTSGGTRIITNCKFENIDPTITGSSSYAHIGYAIYGRGNASTNDKLIINGYNTWFSDIQNVKNAIYAHDMNLDMNNVLINNIPETAVRLERTSTAAVESKLTNNTITARYPISIVAGTGDIVQIVNNTITDINGAANINTEAMVSLNTNNTNLANNPQNSLSNNTLNVYNSRFGIHLLNARGNSNTNRYLVNNNRVVVFNPNAGNPTYAHLRFENVANINITNNIAAEGAGYVKANPSAPNGPGIGTNSTPVGIWTSQAVNSRMSCNNFWTATGSYHQNSSNGFEIITNNYLNRDFGMVFNAYQNATTSPHIPWASNKFYCGFGLNASNYLMAISAPVLITYGNSSTVPTTPPLLFTGACSSGTSTCPTGANRDFRHYWSLPLPSSDFTSITVTTNPDPGCTVACPSPSPEAPPQKLAEADRTDISSLAPSASIYPNPSRGSFRIALEHIDSDILSIEVEIRDVQGRVVYQKNDCRLERREAAIDTQLPAGNYFVRISHSVGLNWMKKLMIE